jgi:hypothetical protein
MLRDDAENERMIDALIQFQRGKWAGVSQEKIPASIVKAAIAAYNPAEKITFNPWKRSREKTPEEIANQKVISERARLGGRAAARVRNFRMTDADRRAWSAKMLAIRWARRA